MQDIQMQGIATSTTGMSSKGQVVIPEAIRRRLGLDPGAQFTVLAGEDSIVPKTIRRPSIDEFNERLAEIRREARRAGLERTDIADAVSAVRRG